MKIRFIVFLSMLSMLMAACEDGATQEGPDEVDPRLEAFAADLADWHCSMDEVCCTAEDDRWTFLATTYESHEACVEAEKARLIDGLAPEHTTLRLDRLQAVWEAHLAYYGTDCDSPPADRFVAGAYDDAVSGLYEGTVAAGAACDFSYECAPGLRCGEDHTCVTLPVEDEACNLNDGCADGLVCHVPTMTCVIARAAGDPCDWELEIPCPDAHHTLTCDEETDLCVAQYEDGAACVSHNNCRSQICGEDNLCAPGTAPLSVAEQFCQADQ